MVGRLSSFVLAGMLLIISCIQAQVATRTGSIYGEVIDENGSPLEDVHVLLLSELISPRTSTTSPAGRFRFANVPPGVYSATFQVKGYTEVKQEEIDVTTGSNIDVKIILKPLLVEEVSILGESSIIGTGNNSNDVVFSSDYLARIPVGHDPWFVLNMTPGVDSGRFNTGVETIQQVDFVARGDRSHNNVWNYDGVNYTDGLGGAPNSYFDFGAFEEIQISTGANDASIQTGGVAINIVTRRAGNKWAGNASYFYSGEDLQWTNTPQELIDNPIINPVTGLPAQGSDRINSVHDFGFNLGGPILKDRFFAWGSYRKYFSNLYDVQDMPKDTTKLSAYNAKFNLNWNSTNESLLGYFLNLKHIDNRPAIGSTIQAPETLWEQTSDPGGGLWNFQHTWIPNDDFLLTGRYGYHGGGFALIPHGGKDVPIIYLSAIPRYENTIWYVGPIERPSHNITVDTNYFKEDFLRADHEFKFGFEYANTSFHTFSSYGNGVLITDYYQTVPGGPLIAGSLVAQHYVNGEMSTDRASFYVADTVRMDRLTLNLALRFDYQTGKNEPTSVPGVPGFEQDVGPFSYSGGDPGIASSDFSPRLGVTYALTNDGKTVVRGNFARYYAAFDPNFVSFSNPTFVYNGAFYDFTNKNGDRVITPDEITGGPDYYGGLNGGNFDPQAFQASRHYDPDLSNPWTNEFLLSFERELIQGLTTSVTYTHRKYGNFLAGNLPFGVSTSDFVPAGNFTQNSLLGNFSVPYFTLGFQPEDAALITNIKDLQQTYNGIDIVVQKRMSNNLFVNAAMTFQNQVGHYYGGDSLGFATTGVVPFDPTNLPFLNNKPYAYGDLRGRLNFFTNWSFKTSAIYQFPMGFAASAYLRYQQGYPYILFGRVEDPNLRQWNWQRHNILVEPIGSRRMDNIFTIDLQFEKIIELKEGNLSLMLAIFNVTNENTVLSRNNIVDSESLNQIDSVLSPRAARIGILYSF